ncbi:MAG: C-GCAxxG-C-C family protein [Bacteroidota bacterium]
MERSEQAKELFLSGHNCSQALLLTFADDLKYSRELALKIASGFGGGMGKQQETCGAVTGAIMVLGLFRGEQVNNNDELKSKTYGSVRELNRQFTEAFQSTNCLKLTGCDLNTPEGEEKFREEEVMKGICTECVKKAVQIVESMID